MHSVQCSPTCPPGRNMLLSPSQLSRLTWISTSLPWSLPHLSVPSLLLERTELLQYGLLRGFPKCIGGYRDGAGVRRKRRSLCQAAYNCREEPRSNFVPQLPHPALLFSPLRPTQPGPCHRPKHTSSNLVGDQILLAISGSIPSFSCKSNSPRLWLVWQGRALTLCTLEGFQALSALPLAGSGTGMHVALICSEMGPNYIFRCLAVKSIIYFTVAQHVF